MTRTPDQVLADFLGEAAVLRHNGEKGKAEVMERVVEAVAESMPDYLTWLSEAEASLRSGWSARRLRSHFPGWVDQRMAEKRGRVRYYRQVVVPRRPNLEAARADAERMARAS